MNTNSMIEFQSVSKIYTRGMFSRRAAVNNISLKIHPGETIALLGANGAGKTTLIRLALGLACPSKGSVHYLGRTLKSKDLTKIGYMPEVNKIALDLSVKEAISDQCLLAGISNAHVATSDAIEVVGLKGQEHKRVRALSKGMGRRLAWALATVHNPHLLFLDEPASGLDPLARRELLGWIREQKKRGTTIILSTHELLQVNDLCDRYIVLQNGKLAQDRTRPVTGPGKYGLHLSGVGEGDIKRLIEQGGLPQAESASFSGYLAKLVFNDYQRAMQWMHLAVKQGYLVTWFGSEDGWVGEEVLPLYQEVKL